MKKIKNSYKKSGVDISLANKLVKHISILSKKDVKKTKNSFDKEIIGGFGSLFDISKIKIKDPVIVSCTDGVGTKIDLANKFKKFDTIGIDLVAMCVNDLIVQGAKPLFFLDYIAVGKLNLKKIKKILKGIFKGCKISDCKLIGGETAEMPGIYSKDKFDLAGFSVGIVSKRKILSKKNVKNNDIILAIPSSGIHSNGYSLIRKIIEVSKADLQQHINGITLGEALMEPTRIYVKALLELFKHVDVRALSHITGGGLLENIPRVLPADSVAVIDTNSWQQPDVFAWLQNNGNVTDTEMYRTFNCGVGMVIVVAEADQEKTLKTLEAAGEKPWVIGNIKQNSGLEDAIILR